MASFSSLIPWLLSTAALASVGALSAVWMLERIQRSAWLHLETVVLPGTTPVLVVVTNRLPRRDLDIVIKRRATLTPHDLILVRPRALRAELLAQSVQTLQMTRRGFGRLPSQDALVEVAPPSAPPPPRALEAEGWVKSLGLVKPMLVPGVGVAPFIMLHLFDRELAAP